MEAREVIIFPEQNKISDFFIVNAATPNSEICLTQAKSLNLQEFWFTSLVHANYMAKIIFGRRIFIC